MDERTDGRKRVWGGRWLAAFAALLLVGTVAASGFVFGEGRAAGTSSVTENVEIRLTMPGASPGETSQLEIDSFAWAVARPSANPSSGPAQAEPLVVSRAMDSASPKLMLACCTGQHIPEVTLELCRGACDKVPAFMVITMKDAMISGYSITASGDHPTETVSFVFQKMTVEYKDPTKKPGQTTGTITWDCTNWPECTCGG